MKKLCFTFFLISNVFLFSNLENDPYYQATRCGDPSSYVGNSVSVISGCYYLKTPKIIVKGREPIDLTRHYVSLQYKDDRIPYFDYMGGRTNQPKGRFSGWDFFDYLRVETSYIKVGPETEDGPPPLLTYFYKIQDPLGPILIYSGPAFNEKKRPFTLDVEKGSFQKALTNSSTGQINARLNIINNKVIKEDERTISVIQADGGKRIYKSQVEDGRGQEYVLVQQIKPNGNKIIYSYIERNLISEIKSTNHSETKVYAWAKIHYKDQKNFKNGKKNHSRDFTITTSDGKTILFRHDIMYKAFDDRIENQFCLLKEIRCDQFQYHFHYQTEHRDTPPMLIGISSGGKKKSWDYYYLGRKNGNYGEDGKIKRGDDKFKRVIALKAPCGPNGTQCVTHKFFYETMNSKLDPGLTMVRDAYTNMSVYRYDDTLRLQSIRRCIGNDLNHSIEKFLWANPVSNEASFLIAKSFLSGDSTPLFSKVYVYDKKGNVICEKLYGNLSGNCPSSLVLLKNNMPLDNDVEIFSKNYTFIDDNRNLLLEEKQSNGLTIKYFYSDQWDLVKSILFIYNGSIIKRIFYDYDHDLLLSKKIEDDGSSEHKEVYDGCSLRKIVSIQNKQTTPYVGLPEVIEEKYYCTKTRKEKTLTKIKLSYDDKGNVCKKAIYDADGDLKQIYTYEYDSRNDLVKETNPYGHITLYCYDKNHNCIFEQDFSGRITESSFDLCNRLIKTEIYKGSSPHYITQHQYNKNHYKIKTIDPRGHETIFKVDPFGHITEKTDPPIVIKDQSLVYPVEKTTYDTLGNPICIISPEGKITRKEYNIRNQVTKIIHPDKTYEKYVYNLDGTLCKHINQKGLITEYTYDPFFRKTSVKTLSPSLAVLKEETFKYSAFELLEKIDAMGNHTTYSYDSSGKKIKETFTHNGQTEITSFSYDTMGFLESETKEDGENSLVTKFKRDLLGNEIEIRKEDRKGNLFSLVEYTYDAAENLSSVSHIVNGQKETETYQYDLFNRVIEKKDSLNNLWTTKYNDFFSNRFNQKVLQKIEENPLGQKTITTYDTHNRLFSIEKLGAKEKMVF